jgi:hypothetical protein
MLARSSQQVSNNFIFTCKKNIKSINNILSVLNLTVMLDLRNFGLAANPDPSVLVCQPSQTQDDWVWRHARPKNFRWATKPDPRDLGLATNPTSLDLAAMPDPTSLSLATLSK